ncbi:MAG TPA: hypothetical protein VF789_10940 [Thermoanaerobaculia bacterium]
MTRPPTDREALIAALAEEARAGAGDAGPPEPEELLDFLAGRLDPEEEERMSRRVAASPEASRALLDLADLEAAGAEAGERPRELGTLAGWRDFERRLPAAAPPRPRRLWTLLPSIAAAALLVCTLGLYGRFQAELSRPLPNPLTAELATVRAAEPSYALAPGQPLRPLLHPASVCPEYKAELDEPGGRRTIEKLTPDPLGNVSLVLPRPAPGTYTLRLHGCEPGHEVEERRFRVTIDGG